MPSSTWEHSQGGKHECSFISIVSQSEAQGNCGHPRCHVDLNNIHLFFSLGNETAIFKKLGLNCSSNFVCIIYLYTALFHLSLTGWGGNPGLLSLYISCVWPRGTDEITLHQSQLSTIVFCSQAVLHSVIMTCRHDCFSIRIQSQSS